MWETCATLESLKRTTSVPPKGLGSKALLIEKVNYHDESQREGRRSLC